MIQETILGPSWRRTSKKSKIKAIAVSAFSQNCTEFPYTFQGKITPRFLFVLFNPNQFNRTEISLMLKDGQLIVKENVCQLAFISPTDVLSNIWEISSSVISINY